MSDGAERVILHLPLFSYFTFLNTLFTQQENGIQDQLNLKRKHELNFDGCCGILKMGNSI